MVVCEVSKESRSMKTVQERSKPLHNFILPTRLRWGNQRFLRCMKVDSNGEILSSSDPDRTRSSASDADSDDKDSKFKTLKSLPSPHSIERNTNTEKRKIAVPEEDESAIASGIRPWNLRTRRAACKAPNNGTERCSNSKLDQRQRQLESLSLQRTENMNPSPKSLRLRGLGLATVAIEKKERCKFSTSLARDEIKEDFFILTGNNLPRRPKKRPRIVQKQLNNLFPGFWLREVTTDSYRVPDELVEIKKK